MKPEASLEIKELIVSIISNMVQARISNIKSGWKTVFHILTATARGGSTSNLKASESLCSGAFGVLERVILEHHPLFVLNFFEGVRCLLAFGQCKTDAKISMKAI